MRRRATFYSSASSRENPVHAPAKPQWRNLCSGFQRRVLLGAVVLLAFLVAAPYLTGSPAEQTISQQAIDAAVARALAEQPLPSAAARVYEAVKGSIVLVRAVADPLESDKYLERAVGSGVVIVDRGIILTSLHVVARAGRVHVVFADGLESEARIVGRHPENDLAVLQADTVPDDLAAAVVRPAVDLRPGDAVVAVGFPFGIGPSVSAGVVSGLKREHRPPGGGGFAGIGFAIPIETASAAAGTPPF